MELGKQLDIIYAGAAVSAASNTDSNSTRIDTANCEGVVFFCTITDSVDTGVAALTIEQNTADSDSGMAALSGAVANLTSAANDDLNGKVLIVSVHKPRERYIQAVRTSTTANIAFGEVYAVKYGVRTMPVADNSTVGEKATTVSPAEA